MVLKNIIAVFSNVNNLFRFSIRRNFLTSALLRSYYITSFSYFEGRETIIFFNRILYFIIGIPPPILTIKSNFKLGNVDCINFAIMAALFVLYFNK